MGIFSCFYIYCKVSETVTNTLLVLLSSKIFLIVKCIISFSTNKRSHFHLLAGLSRKGIYLKVIRRLTGTEGLSIRPGS